MEERFWLGLAGLFAFLGALRGAYTLGSRAKEGSRMVDLFLLAALGSQSLFLYFRGKSIGHCPITNLLETVAFLGWALLLVYLFVGSAYRLSVLGFCTAPVVSLLDFAALIAPIDRAKPLPKMGWPLEVHGTLLLLAYGALGIGAIAGLLYLFEDKTLKSRRLAGWFYTFPALGDLLVVQRRLLNLGFVLLTVGLLAGVSLSIRGSWDWVKLFWSVGVWLLYLVLVCARSVFGWRQRRVAQGMVWGFLFVMLTFWLINNWSRAHQFRM
ncbi:Cytochrome c biogenesis protein CcsA [Methylacidimicrobium cyclopophantes]|uniref:Cytochrome c biogenesis protein CcsA n=1 Tax=Methylacidimicrobium cyclopophantes TaxID=1041766 RepID=A0A5E6MEX9_9BACT|nr:cytochrome c biogenesis protein CcsA [Methylacidimicrobium cyclopophantes]VVM06811.1 Cytochrome c biogenesis protein CcsA [Methylacidimicrobium cyclopophantes]